MENPGDLGGRVGRGSEIPQKSESIYLKSIRQSLEREKRIKQKDFVGEDRCQLLRSTSQTRELNLNLEAWIDVIIVYCVGVCLYTKCL